MFYSLAIWDHVADVFLYLVDRAEGRQVEANRRNQDHQENKIRGRLDWSDRNEPLAEQEALECLKVDSAPFHLEKLDAKGPWSSPPPRALWQNAPAPPNQRLPNFGASCVGVKMISASVSLDGKGTPRGCRCCQKKMAKYLAAGVASYDSFSISALFWVQGMVKFKLGA